MLEKCRDKKLDFKLFRNTLDQRLNLIISKQQLLPNDEIWQIQNIISIILELHSCLCIFFFLATSFMTDGRAVKPL